MDMYHLTETATGAWSVGFVPDGDGLPSRSTLEREWNDESGPQCEVWTAIAPAAWVEAWATAHAGDFEPGCVVEGRHGPSMVDGVIYQAMQAWLRWLDDERIEAAFAAQDRGALETILWCKYGIYGADASASIEATFDLFARSHLGGEK